MSALRVGTSQEQPLQAAKWLKVPVLLDESEMQQLFNDLGDFELYLCGTVRPKGQEQLDRKDFLKHYAEYIHSLKRGVLPASANYQQWFCPVMTAEREALYALPINDTQQLVRVARPIVQLQAHAIDYSPVDKKFRSLVYGLESIPWGIQFSYPQIYQDRDSKEIESTRQGVETKNSLLFQAIQRWMRQHTVPTPFFVEEKWHNVPMRLGKNCFSWINQHPQLIVKGIKVKEPT